MTINYDDTPPVADGDLKQVASLAKQQLILESEVAALELKLKEKKKELFNVQEVALPDLMGAIGLESFVLDTGQVISVKETMYASIPKKSKSQAIKWLMEHGQDALIKTNIILPFDKGDTDKVELALNFLSEAGYTVTMDETVNTASVKAVIKELLAQGEDVPFELFGIHFSKQAKVTT